jgi:uncharacterized protein
MLNFFILFISSIVATTLSSMSGGGAAVINIPVMLSLGISFPLGTAAQRLAGIFWVPVASYNYLKGRKINWKFLISFSIVGMIFAYFGTLAVISIDQHIVGKVIGLLILALVTYVLFDRKVGLQEKKIYSKFKQSISYIFAPFLGFYEGFFASGNGLLFSIAMVKTRGFDFIDSLGYYYAVSLLWDIVVVLTLYFKGYFSLSVMVPVVIGSFIGGYIGSKFGKYKGNRFIKIMFAIIGTVLGLKLLLGL